MPGERRALHPHRELGDTREDRELLERVELEQGGLDLVVQERGVDLVGTRQFVAIDSREQLAVLEKQVPRSRPRGRIDVVESIVSPMIAETIRLDTVSA